MEVRLNCPWGNTALLSIVTPHMNASMSSPFGDSVSYRPNWYNSLKEIGGKIWESIFQK